MHVVYLLIKISIRLVFNWNVFGRLRHSQSRKLTRPPSAPQASFWLRVLWSKTQLASIMKIPHPIKISFVRGLHWPRWLPWNKTLSSQARFNYRRVNKNIDSFRTLKIMHNFRSMIVKTSDLACSLATKLSRRWVVVRERRFSWLGARSKSDPVSNSAYEYYACVHPKN